MPPFEEADDLVHHLPVLLDRHQALARAQAAADGVVEAGAIAELRGGALSEGKELLDEPHGRVHGPPIGIGTEVARAVVQALAGDDQAGIGLVEGQLEPGISLVVLEQDVEIRPMPLDQGVLEHQGLDLGGGRNGLEVVDHPHQGPHLGRVALVLAEVGTHPASKVDRLAHVQDHPGGVLHEVDARVGRQMRKQLLDSVGKLHQSAPRREALYRECRQIAASRVCSWRRREQDLDWRRDSEGPA
ncbi:hypothetical protein D3C86_1008950 [compost metagenome]